MRGPQSQAGRQRKGWLGEAQVKAYYEALGYLVADLSPSYPGTDLLVFRREDRPGGVVIWALELAVEVKTRPWRLCPSPIRQQVGRAANLWRMRGVPHVLWCPDSKGDWETRRVAIDKDGCHTFEGPSGMGFKAKVTLGHAPSTPPPTAGEGGAVE